MPLTPVSPPSAEVEVLALPAADSRGGLAPSLVPRDLLQASLQMVLAERVLLSSPPASELASELASRTQSSLQPLAQVSPTQASLRALLQVSRQALVQPLAQVSLRSSGRASLVSMP